MTIHETAFVLESAYVDDGAQVGAGTKVWHFCHHVSRQNVYGRTLVRCGASIGANATIVYGSTLGEYAFVRAGALVASDVPAFGLMVAIPARRIGWMCGRNAE